MSRPTLVSTPGGKNAPERSPAVIGIIGLVALIAALEVQVRLVEESYLLAAQGDRYRTYAHRVGRFAPGIGRIR